MLNDSARLEQRIARIRRAYGDEMSAKDISMEEGCSPATAARRMRAFDYGALTKRNARVVRCYTDGYVEYLRTKTVVTKMCA